MRKLITARARKNKRTARMLANVRQDLSIPLDMLWEHEPQESVSTAFSSSPKLSREFLWLDRNTEYTFSISFRKQRDEKKENNFLTLIIKM